MSEVPLPEVREAAGAAFRPAELPPPVSPGADAWRRLRRNPVAVACMLYIGLLILAALFANFLAPYRYDFQDIQRYASLPAPPDHHHVLGTDDLGQDVLSRLLYGARISLGVTVVVVGIEVLVGVPLGLAAGYYSGRIDLLLMRLTDVMFAFPDILLAILLTAIVRAGSQALPPIYSLLTLFIALGVVGWPGIARLVRGQALSLREKEFMEAARAMGVRDSTIIRRHLLPNLLSPIIVQVTQDVAGVILAEATLSFLGLGVQPPFPSWGRMIQDALPYKEAYPLLLLLPSLVLALTVMAFNFFGDALRDALDPRLRSYVEISSPVAMPASSGGPRQPELDSGNWWDKQAAPYRAGSFALWFHIFCCQCPGVIIALLLLMGCRTKQGKENGLRLLKYSLAGIAVAIVLRVLLALAASGGR